MQTCTLTVEGRVRKIHAKIAVTLYPFIMTNTVMGEYVPVRYAYPTVIHWARTLYCTALPLGSTSLAPPKPHAPPPSPAALQRLEKTTYLDYLGAEDADVSTVAAHTLEPLAPLGISTPVPRGSLSRVRPKEISRCTGLAVFLLIGS